MGCQPARAGPSRSSSEDRKSCDMNGLYCEAMNIAIVELTAFVQRAGSRRGDVADWRRHPTLGGTRRRAIALTIAEA